MNEVILIAQTGDAFNELVKTGIEIVKIRTVSYCLLRFNECKIFIKKDTTEENAMGEYLSKLNSKI